MRVLKITYSVFKYVCFFFYTFLLSFMFLIVNDKIFNFNDNRYQFMISPDEKFIVLELVPIEKNEQKIWYSFIHLDDDILINYQNEFKIADVVVINNVNDEYIFKLGNDDKSFVIDSSNIESSNYIYGEVVYENSKLGHVINNLFLSSDMLFFVTLPLIWILLIEVIYLSYKKGKKDEETNSSNG